MTPTYHANLHGGPYDGRSVPLPGAPRLVQPVATLYPWLVAWYQLAEVVTRDGRGVAEYAFVKLERVVRGQAEATE